MDYQLNKGGALFYGIMLGDGCLSHHQSKDGQDYFFISITCSYRDDQEFMKEILLPLTIKLREKNVNIKQRPEKGTVELNFTDKRLFQKIKGLNFPVGKKGPELAIPKVFYEQRLLKEIVQIASKVTDADSCLIYVLNPKENELVLRASKNPHQSLLKKIKIKLGEGITGWVAQHNKRVVLKDQAYQDKRFLDVVSTIAAQLGTVIQRKRAEETLRKAYEELEKQIQDAKGKRLTSQPRK